MQHSRDAIPNRQDRSVESRRIFASPKRLALGLLGLVSLLASWQVAVAAQLLPGEIPSPLQSGLALWSMMKDGSAATNVAASLYRVGLGFVIGSLLAFLTCCAFWLSPAFRGLTELTVEIIRPVPPIAVIPFVIFALGLGDLPAIFLVTLAAYFPMQSVTDSGFLHAPVDQTDVARTFGASKLQILRFVIIPSARPAIVSGLRASAGVSWFVVIVAELVGAQNGLGYLIQESRLSFELDRAVAAIVLVAVAGVSIQALLALLTGLFVPRDETDA